MPRSAGVKRSCTKLNNGVLSVSVPMAAGVGHVAGCQLWEVGTWKRGLKLEYGQGMGFSPDGVMLAVINDHTIRLVEPESGREFARLEDPNLDRAHDPTFSPDGTQLIVATGERRVLHVWDLRRIREGLEGLGLDWDRPPYPSANSSPDEGTPPVFTVDVIGDDPASLQRRDEPNSTFDRP